MSLARTTMATAYQTGVQSTTSHPLEATGNIQPYPVETLTTRDDRDESSQTECPLVKVNVECQVNLNTEYKRPLISNYAESGTIAHFFQQGSVMPTRNPMCDGEATINGVNITFDYVGDPVGDGGCANTYWLPNGTEIRTILKKLSPSSSYLRCEAINQLMLRVELENKGGPPAPITDLQWAYIWPTFYATGTDKVITHSQAESLNRNVSCTLYRRDIVVLRMRVQVWLSTPAKDEGKNPLLSTKRVELGYQTKIGNQFIREMMSDAHPQRQGHWSITLPNSRFQQIHKRESDALLYEARVQKRFDRVKPIEIPPDEYPDEWETIAESLKRGIKVHMIILYAKEKILKK